MICIEIKCSFDAPGNGGCQIYNPKFREMGINQAIQDAGIKRDYLPYGYNLVYFAQMSGTLHLYQSPNNHKLIIECEDWDQAFTIERNAKKRHEMRHVNIRTTKPYYKSDVLESWKHFNDMGQIWKQ